MFSIRYIRYTILCSSILLAGMIFFYWQMTLGNSQLTIIRLTQTYALIAVHFLYFALLPGPLYKVFPTLPFRALYTRARRAIGVSAFLYAFLHACFAFFGQLGGFNGLSFLSTNYLIAISLSFFALLVLALMAATSFDAMMARMGKYWKWLHRLVYLASVAIIIHALMLGTHFQNIYAYFPQTFFCMILILLILEALATDKLLASKFPSLPHVSFASLLATIIITVSSVLLFFPAEKTQSLNLHASHQSSGGNTTSFTTPNTVKGTKRYTMSFIPETTVVPEQETTLRFKVYEAGTGRPVVLFQNIHEKLLHLIIVDNSLTYYNHIHPEQKGDEFSIATTFPKAGIYRLYLDFKPLGATDQQFAFTLPVGTSEPTSPTEHYPDTDFTKSVSNYNVTLDTPTLSAQSLNALTQKIRFTVTDSQETPVTTLKPYLGAFGHLVMINTQTYQYIHIHPANMTAPPPNASSGPTVEFMPMSLYEPMEKGIYRMFVQLNPNNELITTDFTVEVK